MRLSGAERPFFHERCIIFERAISSGNSSSIATESRTRTRRQVVQFHRSCSRSITEEATIEGLLRVSVIRNSHYPSCILEWFSIQCFTISEGGVASRNRSTVIELKL